MGLRLNKALRLLNVSLREANSVLKDRKDLGEFRDKLSWKITLGQFNLLKEYARNASKHYDEVLVNEFLQNRNNDIFKKDASQKQKIGGKVDLEKINQQNLPHKKDITDKNKNANIKNINIQTKIENNIKSEEAQKRIFRHKRPKTITIKNDGSKILETTPYAFLYKKDSIKFNYKDNELTLYANGVSSILNEYTQEIIKTFPSVKIKIGGNNTFHFINPKFYNFITDLCFKINKEKKQAKSEKKVIKDLSISQRLKGIQNPNLIRKDDIKRQLLQSENLEFFDYHYKIWVIDNNRVKCRDITPTVIRDENSRACLNILNKYFTNRLPRNIFIQYSNERVVAVDKRPILSAYIKILKENISIHGDWEYELCNYRKRTLDDCRKIEMSK